jgi:hypothetical protein
MNLAWPVKLRKRLLNVFLILWALTTLAALAGMYHLWWTREHRLYDGKGSSEQRAEVFKRAGLSQALLKDTEVIDRTLPRHIRYEAVGDHNQLSYVKYLLLPRIPSGSDYWVIKETEGKLQTNADFPDQGKGQVHPSKSRGFLISLLLLLGVAVFLKHFHFLQSLSLPEGLAAAFLLLTLFAVLSRALSGDATFGFWPASALGICGWVLVALKIPGCKWDSHFKKIFTGTDFSMGMIRSRAVWIFLILIIGLAFLWSVLMSVVVVPDDWDAWAIWGAKAKVLALGQGPLRDVTYFDHADYPLLWPSLWAFSGWCAGGWEEHWSRVWGPVLMLLCAWETGVIIHRLSLNATAGLFGAALFVSIPMVPLLASWSYAEAPLWLMSACSFGRLLLWRKEKENRHLLIAALFAAAAAYTKNEGLFIAALCFSWLILVAPREWRTCLRWYALPLTLLYLPWFLWVRGVLALGSHAVEGFQGGGGAALVRALDRLPAALKSIGAMWLDIRQWNLVVWVVLALSLVHLCRARGHRMDLFVPCMMLFVFFLINVFHMQEIGLLMSSWNRLTAQTLPLFLMVLGACYLPAALGRDHP